MKRISLSFLAVLFIALTISLSSCKKEPEGLKDLQADDSTFADFKKWTLKATKNGVDPSLGQAHGGNDANTVRTIYFKDNATRSDDGKFPIGTIINKLSHNDTTSLDMRTGMVKRAVDYDADKGNWEYFILKLDGSIATDTDGNSLRGNSAFKTCYGCHKGAKANDYVFTD